MAVTHIKPGSDFFGAEHNAGHAAFGFHGSVESGQPTRQRGGSPPFAGNEPTGGTKRVPEPMEAGEGGPHDYAKGGNVHPHHHPHGHQVHHVERHNDGAVIEHHAHGGFTHHHPDGHVTHHHHNGTPVQHHAQGGAAHHMHPHGHHVMHTEHREHDGAVVMHHAHGGHTVHHADGRVTHHHGDGSPVHGMAHGGIEHMHDPEGEYVHRARGGHMPHLPAMPHLARGGDPDAGQDKAMIEKAFAQHDRHMHHAAPEHLSLARGGHARLPRSMKPMAERPHSPINTPPRNPNMTTTPHNDMAGGQMGYGVQPSAEPDDAGSEQGIPQLRHGGRVRHHRG